MMKNEIWVPMTDEMDRSYPPTSPTAKMYCCCMKPRPNPNSQTADQKRESAQEGKTPGDPPDKWCIYRVPSKLRKVNEAAYTPQLVSIGPFHHGKPELNDMEGHKNIYCENFCVRSGKSKDELKQFIEERKDNILACYAGPTELHIDIQIILVDACFIIELFLMNYETENHENDYILRSPWLRKGVEQDLLLFENQVPYSLLEDLYKFARIQAQEKVHEPSNTNHEHWCCLPCFQHCFHCSRPQADDANVHPNVHPFLKLTCEFFKDYNKGKSVKSEVKLKHFTDLVRYFLCPEEELIFKDHSLRPPTKNIYVVKQLRAAGVKFRALDEKQGYLIKVDAKIITLACFRNMYLRLTQFCVKDETECIIRNVMAFEQFLYPNKAYICNYFLLLDELVDTVEDVNLLVEKKVIINMLGSDKAVAKLINSLCEHIMEDKSCYVNVGKRLNEHYENFWNRHVATLRQVYFKDLWTASATIVGFCVVVLSITVSLRTIIVGHKLCIHK